MKKQKHSESQIVNSIKEHDAGKSAMDICRELGVHKEYICLSFRFSSSNSLSRFKSCVSMPEYFFNPNCFNII